jgi:hypothetical protein
MLDGEQGEEIIVDYRAVYLMADGPDDRSQVDNYRRLDIAEGDAEQDQGQECSLESHS